MNINKMMEELTDQELQIKAGEAVDDLALAADNEPNSEWHEACFAAVILYGQEFSRRNIPKNILH